MSVSELVQEHRNPVVLSAEEKQHLTEEGQADYAARKGNDRLVDGIIQLTKIGILRWIISSPKSEGLTLVRFAVAQHENFLLVMQRTKDPLDDHFQDEIYNSEKSFDHSLTIFNGDAEACFVTDRINDWKATGNTRRDYSKQSTKVKSFCKMVFGRRKQ